MTAALLTPALRWFELLWPRSIEYDEHRAVLRQIAGSRQAPLLLRSEARQGLVRHLVGSTSNRPAELVAQHLPGAQYREAEPAPVPTSALALGLRFSTRRRAVASEAPDIDSQALLAALARAGNETIVLEWSLLTTLAAEAVPARIESAGPEAWLSALVLAPLAAPGSMDGERRRALAAKRTEPGWRGIGRLAVAASSARAETLARGVLSALRAVESPGLRLIVRRTRPGSLGAAGVLTGRPAAVNISELPLLAGWPVGDLRGRPVNRLASRHLPAHPAMPVHAPDSHQRLVAVGRRGQVDRALVLSTRDASRHLHLVGPTGAGKSTALLHLIAADMAAGRSVVVFDPKGDLASDVLSRVPTHRQGDVVVLDPTQHSPVGLNPLAAGEDGDAEAVADRVLGTLHELFVGSWGVRSQDILHACLLTLAARPSATLAQIPLLLTNDAYRGRLTAGLDDPLGVGGFWQAYEAQSDSERRQAIGPVMNKLRQILNRSAFRAVVGQAQPRFDLSDVFRRRHVVVVNLAKGLLGPEGSALYGALVWARLWQSAQLQAGLAPERRRPVMVFADEFQDYLRLPVSFTDMLVQCRGLGVGLTLAHQHLGQLGSDVRDTVLANAGSRVAFQLLDSDAVALAKHSPDLEPEDFAGLGQYEVYATLRVGGEATGWMSGRTLPPRPAMSDPNRLRQRSSERYGRSRAETEAALRTELNPPGEQLSAGDLGRRRRRGGTT